MVTGIRIEDSEEIIREACDVINSEDSGLRSSLHKDLIINALKCTRDDLDILDIKILSKTIAEFRLAASIFRPFRDIRKVSIFGSGRVPQESSYYQMAVEFGRLMAEEGMMVITGAAEGIMRAGIEGAGAQNSFGVKILLPFEESPNRIIHDDPKLINFRYFFTRKVFFVMEADAVALFPGGFGTHDEGFEVLTLLQTGKASPMPVVLIEAPGENYWGSWDRFIRLELLTRDLISREDLSFYRIVRTPQEARDWIRFYYSTYNSTRYVRNRLVIRLEHELTAQQLVELNEKFRDIIDSGEIRRTEAMPEEADEPGLLSKPRITLAYNRKSAGRLNEMILEINRLGRSWTESSV